MNGIKFEGILPALITPLREDNKSVNETSVRKLVELHMVRKLVALRKSSDALGSDGKVDFLNRESRGYPLVYSRTDGVETYLMCMNPSAQTQTVDLKKIDGKDKQYQGVLQNKEVVFEHGVLTLPGVSFWIGKDV